MSEYFLDPNSLGKVKVEAYLKNATGIDTSSFAKRLI